MATIKKEQAFIQPLNPIWYLPYVEKIDMLRLDMLHPVISGNKWFKLKHNLNDALAKGFDTILTFGGAYSNHLLATAAAVKEYDLKSIGVVRGIYPEEELSPTLLECISNGMQLEFISREEYAKKDNDDWLKKLLDRHPRAYIIPEGGANEKGREGAEEIAEFISPEYTHICIAVGTGTTFIGLRNALPAQQEILGFVPMKQGQYIEDEIMPLIKGYKPWELFDNWHFGGFGKWNEKLLAFMNNFYVLNNIPLDFVYTAKMMYGVEDLLPQHFFPPNAKILCIHTGGLQGNNSIQELMEY